MTAINKSHREWPTPGVAPAGVASSAVTVAVVDPHGLANAIDRLLPRRWLIRRYTDIYQFDEADLLLLGSATPFGVASARLLHPRAELVALIDQRASANAIVDLLHSGADTVVRSGALQVLAAHLMAGHRRSVRRRYATRAAA